MDFVVLRAIYRSRVQFLKVMYSQFCINLSYTNTLEFSSELRGLRHFFPSDLLSSKCFVYISKQHPKLTRLISTVRGLFLVFLFRVFEIHLFIDTKGIVMVGLLVNINILVILMCLPLTN